MVNSFHLDAVVDISFVGVFFPAYARTKAWSAPLACPMQQYFDLRRESCTSVLLPGVRSQGRLCTRQTLPLQRAEKQKRGDVQQETGNPDEERDSKARGSPGKNTGDTRTNNPIEPTPFIKSPSSSLTENNCNTQTRPANMVSKPHTPQSQNYLQRTPN